MNQKRIKWEAEYNSLKKVNLSDGKSINDIHLFWKVSCWFEFESESKMRESRENRRNDGLYFIMLSYLWNTWNISSCYEMTNYLNVDNCRLIYEKKDEHEEVHEIKISPDEK
jgi:predicted transposase YbfD/YdcC